MNDKIEIVKRILNLHSSVEFAYLFGSRLKATANKRSDWDIAVFFKKEPKKFTHWATFYLEAEISSKIGEEVQIVSLNNLDSPILLFHIINGVVLIDKNTKKRILFEARTLSKYHDWQYFLRKYMKVKKYRK